MGGGNGQKSRMARERNMEKNKPSKGSQLVRVQQEGLEHPVQGVYADIHMCREHAEAKHPKAHLYSCFPHLKK